MAGGAQTMTQRFSLEELGDDVDLIVVRADVVDCDDVRVRQRGDRLRLALEPRAPLGVGGKAPGKDLDGDVAMQPRVAGAIDLAHSALAEEHHDFIGSESSSRRQSHVNGCDYKHRSIDPSTEPSVAAGKGLGSRPEKLSPSFDRWIDAHGPSRHRLESPADPAARARR